jgi:hypothetical protein
MENKNVINENDVLIYAAVNEKVINQLETISKEQGITLVRLQDKLLSDYIKSVSNDVNDAESVDAFLANDENRSAAESKALYLWNLLTNNAATDNAEKRIFTKSQVVNKTTLTNKSLGELLQLFDLFGLIVFTKGSYEFKFIFSNKLRQTEAYADVIQNITDLNVNIARYKNLFKDESLRVEAIKELQENINKLIQI